MKVKSGSGALSAAFVPIPIGGTKLLPGSTMQAPLTITNTGELPMNWRLESTSIYTGLTLSIFPVTSESLCPVGAGQTTPTGTPPLNAQSMSSSVQFPNGGWSSAPLGVGASAVWCFRVGVTATGVQPATPKIVFTMAGTYIP